MHMKPNIECNLVLISVMLIINNVLMINANNKKQLNCSQENNYKNIFVIMSMPTRGREGYY